VSTVRAFKTAFKKAEEKKWDKIYIGVDLHDTVLEANYSDTDIPLNWLPGAEEVISMLSDRGDVHLILWTCSHPKEIEEYLKFFESQGVHFDDIHFAGEVKNTSYGCFDHKPYFNIVLEDKAGFHYTDYPYIKEFLINQKTLES